MFLSYLGSGKPEWPGGQIFARSDLVGGGPEEGIRDLEVDGENLEISVKDALGRWISDCEARRLREETLRKYRARKRELEEKFGSLPIGSVSLDDLRKPRESWTVQASSASKRVEIFRSFFGFCLNSGWVGSNPAAQLTPPKVRQKAKLPFTKSETEKIMWAVDTYPEIYPTTAKHTLNRMRAMVLLMRYSGLRISDVISLKAEKISGGKIFLHQAKSGQPVWLPLPKKVLKALTDCDLGDGRFFWDEQGKLKTTVTDWQVRLKKSSRFYRGRFSPLKYWDQALGMGEGRDPDGGFFIAIQEATAAPFLDTKEMYYFA